MVSETATSRLPLSPERVLAAAVELADRDGIDGLTMRNLAHDLGVEAMSLYYHVANKEAMLDGVVGALMEELEDDLGGFAVPEDMEDWKQTMRNRILTARQVMLRHPWAPGLFETRTKMAPSIVHYFDSLLGILIEGGFNYDLAHHCMHALGSRALGFAQELFKPGSAEEDEESQEMLKHNLEQLPYLAGMLMAVAHDDGPDETLGWCDDQTEFEFSLDLLLNGMEALRTRS